MPDTDPPLPPGAVEITGSAPPLPPGAVEITGSAPPLPTGATETDASPTSAAPAAPPKTSLSGLAGSFSRGAAPYAAGALLGAPFLGVGAPVGVAAVGATQLAGSLYNPVADKFGLPKMVTPQDLTDKLLDYFGTNRPSTGLERFAETIGGGLASGGAGALSAGALAGKAAPGLARDVLGKMAERPGVQALSGAAGGVGAQSAAELGAGPLGQTLAGLATGAAPGMRATKPNTTPAMRADAAIENSLAQGVKTGEISPREVVRSLQEGRGLGKPLTIADVGGTNAKSLAGAVSRRPGESRSIMQELRTRDEGAGKRLEVDIGRELSAGPSARQTETGLRQAQYTVGNPLYEKAFEPTSVQPLREQVSGAIKQAARAAESADTKIKAANERIAKNIDDTDAVKSLSEAELALREAQDNMRAARGIETEAATEMVADRRGGVWSPEINRLLSNPDVKKGVGAGMRILRNEADASNRLFDPTDFALVGVDAEGNPQVGKVPNMRLLDAAKKGLDSIIQEQRQPDGRLSMYGVSVDKLRRSLLDELDRANPDYKKARDAWSSSSATVDALNFGKNIGNIAPEVSKETMAAMSSSDKEFARLGVAEYLRERVQKTAVNADEAKRILGNEWAKGQLKPVFGSEEAFDRFVKSVDFERMMHETKQAVLGGSQTAERQAADMSHNAQMAARGVHAASHAVTGNWLSAALSALSLRRQFGLRSDPAMETAIARRMTETTGGPVEAGSRLSYNPMGGLPGQRVVPVTALPAWAGAIQPPRKRDAAGDTIARLLAPRETQ